MMGYGRGRGGPAGMNPNLNKFNYQQEDDGYGDEDDMGDYGMDYYAEDSDDDDQMDMDPQYLKNAPPGSLFTGGPKPGPPQFGAQNVGGGMMGAGGVPFYSQQNKMPATAGFGMGGAMGMSGAMGMGGPSTGAGGGFTYGMASKGGSMFGPSTGSNPLGMSQNTFGAPASSQQNPGLFQFGSVSQFGGLGGAGALGGIGAGQMFGASQASAVNDPYANIAIDLTKVKKSEPPAKPYEQKTKEEKKTESDKSANNAKKSNLKRDADDDDDKGKRKRGVSFGKSTTYEVEGINKETEDSGDFHNKDLNSKGSPRPTKKVIDEKDLSDGRTEKEKIKEMLAKQEAEQLEEIQKMEEWKAKTSQSKKDDKKSASPTKDFKKMAAKEYEDSSIGESSSMSNANFTNFKKQQQQQEKESSYESDTFEDASVSGSGNKTQIKQWPGKGEFLTKKSEESPSVSQSHDKDDDMCDADMMEQYLKKQQQSKQGGAQVQKPPVKYSDASESSDKYEDEEFDSYSKSQTGMTNSMLVSPNPTQQNQQQQKNDQQKVGIFDYKQPPTAQFKSVLETYVKKENKFIQTDEGKYTNMGPTDMQGSSYKEWTLQQNLKDAENLIQELKDDQAQSKQRIYDLESQLKKKDVEFQTQRREALNATETSKRLQESLKDAIHKNGLYKIETEELIKQIDLADAKTREKEDELKLALAEYDRKLKLQEERILFRRGKSDERDTYELKRQHDIEKEELKRIVDEKSEELDYYMQKVAKIEVENKTLRVGKDSNKRVKELEEEIDSLKGQLSHSYKSQQENINLKNLSKELSKEEQVRLQRELQQLELMVKGYQEENEKSVSRVKTLEKELKMSQERFHNETKKAKDLHQKLLLNTEKVYVEEKKEELDISTVNTMGLSNAISQKELQELYTQLKKLQSDKSDLERDLNLKESQLKQQISKVRDEKATTEKSLYETEFLVGEKERELTRLREEFLKENQQLRERVNELEEKVQWFRENQKLIHDEDEDKQNFMKELMGLREKVKKAEEDSKRTRDLEKKCKLLEETIKSKNPNSISMLIQATKEIPVESDNLNIKTLQEKNKTLEFELENRDRDFEKRIRTLRQEQERMKQLYEKRQGQTPEAKRVTELEDELQKTKNYYNKRIREIEDKYKFRVNAPNEKIEKTLSSKPLAGKSQKLQQDQQSSDQTRVLQEQIDKLTKDRNLLAQKVVKLETANNQRRQSFSVQQSLSLTINDESKLAFQAVYAIAGLMKQIKKSDQQSAFLLIEAALACVEQIKANEPLKKKNLSQLLLDLTRDLKDLGSINDKLIIQVFDICKKEGYPTEHQPIKHMNSATNMNKDLSGIMSFTEDDTKQRKSESPQKKPPKPVHPFVVLDAPKRQIKDIMKSLVQSGVDFEQLLLDNGIKQKRISIQQLYQLLKDEQILKNISVDDVKMISKYVKEHSGFASEEMGKHADDIDVQELNNVILDQSVDLLGYEVIKPNDSVLASNRYSYDKTAQLNKTNDQVQSKGNQDELNRLRQQKEQDDQEYNNRIQRMQRMIHELNAEKSALEDTVQKLESSKTRMERILKQNLGLKGTLRKNGADPDNNDILEEVALVMKRIEYLEQQSEERTKMQMLEHGPCKRDIHRLQEALEQERLDKARLLTKKNSEIAHFKSELDCLMQDMQSTFAKKGSKY